MLHLRRGARPTRAATIITTALAAAVFTALAPPMAAPAASAPAAYAAAGDLGAASTPAVRFGVKAGSTPGCSTSVGPVGCAANDLEARIGQPVTILRRYFRWDERPYEPHEVGARAGGRRLQYVSVEAERKDGREVPWAAIAAATPGTPLWDEMAAWADRVKAWGGETWVAFNHEPEDPATEHSGAPVGSVEAGAEFRGAFRTFAAVFRSRGVTNTKFSYVGTAWGFNPANPNHVVDRYWPGDDVVDVVGVDGYNWNHCRANAAWRSPQEVYAAARDFAATHGKPWAMAEVASNEDAGTPGRKAAWMHELADAVIGAPGWGGLVAVVWFDSTDQDCDWRWNSTPGGGTDDGGATASAFRALARDGRFTSVGGTPFWDGAGYLLAAVDGSLTWFGTGRRADGAGRPGTVDVTALPTARGLWSVTADGVVDAWGGAKTLGGAPGLRAGEAISSISATPSGAGYWLFSTLGRVFPYGDAATFGDLSSVVLNGPIRDSVASPSGRGYYLVGDDGGVFAFGDATFRGSMGGIRLNAPVRALVPTPSGRGYWLVAGDGGVFAFGDAAFRGSMGGRPLNAPVTAMISYGDGYLMVGADGGVFDFSNRPFQGSLATAGGAAIVSVADVR